jgi:phenylacetyl-CoA:acceptor oxidoreductase subunit 1
LKNTPEKTTPDPHWGMVIDLRKCVGCGICAVACSRTNKVEANFWRRVVDCGVGEPPERERLCLPLSCMHCSKPPCLDVCPTKATFQRADGVVDIDSERCVGCGYCIVACPYMARSIIFHSDYDFEDPPQPEVRESADDNRNKIGVCTKCNFCSPKVNAGLEKGLTPGVDADATPACVLACTGKALHFGDLNDPESPVGRLIRENDATQLQKELGTEPSVYYIFGRA